MPKPGRTATRWALPTIGLAAVACVGCCALPLLAAGSFIGGGLAAALTRASVSTSRWSGLGVRQPR